jgi:hypothetical protein
MHRWGGRGQWEGELCVPCVPQEELNTIVFGDCGCVFGGDMCWRGTGGSMERSPDFPFCAVLGTSIA